MAWKGRGTEDKFDYKALQTSLVNSKSQQSNNALYQTIKGLIDGAENFKNGLSTAFNKETDKLELSSQVSGVLPVRNGGIFSNWYIPAIGPTINIASANPYYTHYLVTARLAQVSGKLDITPTAANTLTEIQIELPIHSNFISSDQLQGLINGIPVGGGTEGFAGIITGNTGSGMAHLSFFPQNTNTHDCRFMLTYELI